MMKEFPDNLFEYSIVNYALTVLSSLTNPYSWVTYLAGTSSVVLFALAIFALIKLENYE